MRPVSASGQSHLVQKFLSHLQQRNSSTRILSAGTAESVESVDQRALWSLAQSLRAVWRQRGMRRGDVLAICLPSCNTVLAAILAAWSDGLSVCLLPHEVASQSGRLTPQRFGEMLRQIAPACVLLEPALITHAPAELAHIAISSQDLMLQASSCRPASDGPRTRADDTAILQFTSGSTGAPNAAVITHAMLSANCAAIAERIQVDAQDRVLSWLPLHHDMGLSALTMSWWAGLDLLLMPTAVYMRQPMLWLESIFKYRATLSPAPASAYALLARLAHSAADKKLDLSSWRYAWAGAEPVFYQHLQQFELQMEPFGLRRGVLQPAYGMAEAVVAISLNAPGHYFRTVWIDAGAATNSDIVTLQAADSPGSAPCVSNGRPLSGTEVRVLTVSGPTLAELHMGELQIRGHSIIAHYLGKPGALDAEGWFATGDIGFLHRGEIYVCGRAKDLITRAGGNLSPHDIEWRIEALYGLREGSVAVFSCIDALAAVERVVAVVAQQPGSQLAVQMRQQIAASVARQHALQLHEIVFIKRSCMPRTTSGKIQRSALRDAYMRGSLASVN